MCCYGAFSIGGNEVNVLECHSLLRRLFQGLLCNYLLGCNVLLWRLFPVLLLGYLPGCYVIIRRPFQGLLSGGTCWVAMSYYGALFQVALRYA